MGAQDVGGGCGHSSSDPPVPGYQLERTAGMVGGIKRRHGGLRGTSGTMIELENLW
jgi:hypothetical protein